MAEFPALPLFTDAYLADTRHLTTAQHGAYLLILIAMWRTPDCTLMDDDALLARISGVNSYIWKKQIKPALWAFFHVTDGRVSQSRLMRERRYVEARRDQQISAGMRSAIKKQERRSHSPQGLQNPVSQGLKNSRGPRTVSRNLQNNGKLLKEHGNGSTLVAPPLQREVNEATNGKSTKLPTPTPTPLPTEEPLSPSGVSVLPDILEKRAAAASENGNGHLKYAWPQAAGWICKEFPKTDQVYAEKTCGEIAALCLNAIRKGGGNPDRFTDEAFVKVLKEARFARQQSAAGFKKTAPAVAANWSK